jgi:protein-S-isoprenylcysteine O-methyltransferase Ste14
MPAATQLRLRAAEIAGTASGVALVRRFSEWYARESTTANYDWFIRLPALLYFGTGIWMQVRAISWEMTAAEPPALSSLSARLAALAVLVLFAVLTLMRSRPVARSKGLVPRLAAVIGVAAGFGFAFLERPEPVAWLDAVSAVTIAISGVLTCYVLLWLGRSFSTMPEARNLVTSGPYRFVRHPLYVAEELAVLGLFLQYRTAPALLLIVVQIALQLSRMRYEERVLGAAFPDEYEAYSRTTARLIPGVY